MSSFQENARLQDKNSELIHYIRAKTDRLLQVMGTIPLNPEELDDETLLALDPIGIVSDAFEQVLEHLKRINRDLTTTHDELQAVFDAAGAGIVVVNNLMEVVAYNRYSQQVLFNGESQLLGRNLRQLLCAKEDECILEQILSTGNLVEQDKFEHNDRSYHLIGTPIKADDGSIIQMVLFYSDITERLIAAREIERLAFYDSLTGLPNRVLLKDRLFQMLLRAERQSGCVAVLFIDLDNFKEINDTLGHSNGDLLLQLIAERLTDQLRSSDTVARLGGDEFVVLLEVGEDLQGVEEVACKLLTTLGQPAILASREVNTNGSIGISLYPRDGASVDELFQNADTAMYQAKQLGKNRFCFYSEEMHASALELLNMSSYLRHAVEHQEFFLVYQPQIQLATGRLVGMEVLLRWNHPELGLLEPGRIIPVAEENGLIMAIGNWVLETACHQAMHWIRQGLPEIRVAINISPRQLRDPDLISMIRDVLQQSGLPPHLLELELTEQVLFENLAGSRVSLKALKELGVTLAIDDFGIGYSSLSYLRHFSLNRVKIDMSFVQEIAEQSDDAAMVVDALIALAHSLRLHVIAERVENTEQVMFLMQRHCDELQGFYFSKPLMPHEFEQLLKKSMELTDFSLLRSTVR